MKKDLESLFKEIAEKILQKHEGTHMGKMMSAEGIQWNKKNFACYYQEAMIFKLGKDFNPESYGLTDWHFLSPFKTKPPMKAWFVIGPKDKDQWWVLTELALQKMKA